MMLSIPSRTSTFWRRYARVYDLIWDSPLTVGLATVLVGASPRGASVVDLGCGTGLIAAQFVASGHHVIGVDSSTAMLERAVQRGRVSEARLAPAERTGLRAGSASVAVLSNVLHLHAEPALLLAEACRITGPAGRVLASWPVEGISHGSVIWADLESGRSVHGTILAAALRTAVSAMALLARVSVADGEALEQRTLSELRGRRASMRTFAGSQRVLLIEPDP